MEREKRSNIHKMPLDLGIDSKVRVHGAVTISNVKIYGFFIYGAINANVCQTHQRCPCKPSKQTSGSWCSDG